MFSRGWRERIVGNVVSVQGAIIFSVLGFDSPAIVLNDTPNLKKNQHFIQISVDLFLQNVNYTIQKF